MKSKNKPVTLLYVSRETSDWMKAQADAITKRQGGNLGLSTIARAVLNGICEAGIDFSSCRGETDIIDRVRTLVSATTTEVKA
ncbi:MAG: hypothetical protein JST11_01105 [Acidobacteria bacterium]|nr:hypothetical protein [Acidobacteriota bacterium]